MYSSEDLERFISSTRRRRCFMGSPCSSFVWGRRSLITSSWKWYKDTGNKIRERQSLEMKELLRTPDRIARPVGQWTVKDSEFRSRYYTEALNYLNRFWKEIFAYLDDGELPIDNNLAERTIRKLTTQRNNSLHYGSDTGAEMAATYHSVIGTVKLHGTSVWNFIGTFFKNIFNGCRDYVNMVPDKITLAAGQC